MGWYFRGFCFLESRSSTMESSKRSAKAEFWQHALQQFVESKLCVTDFCSQKGLSVPSFYQWKRKLLSPDKTPPVSAMVPVRIIPSNPTPSPQPIQIVTPSGFSIRVDSSMPSTQLARLIAAIEAGSRGESC
jgi:transposase